MKKIISVFMVAVCLMMAAPVQAQLHFGVKGGLNLSKASFSKDNGEISSYDANRRFIEMFGYKCTLQTDTEVITYIMDYLLRVQGLTLKEAAEVIAAPFWSTIAADQDLESRKTCTYLRTLFPSLLITGPFSIVLGFDGGLMALNDRLKLRSMVVGEKADKVFIASEEAAIRTMEPEAEHIWAPAGGEPVIVKVKEGAY